MLPDVARYCGARRDRTDDLLNANQALSQLSYGPEIYTAGSETVAGALKAFSAAVVGQGGFEPPTSPLSGVRSNQLSYRPESKQQSHYG